MPDVITPTEGTTEVSANAAAEDYTSWLAERENAEKAAVEPSSPETAAEEPAPAETNEETEPEKAEVEDESEAAEADEGEGDKKKKGGFQRRIDKLTREREELRKQLEEARKAAEQPAAPKATPEAADDPEPVAPKEDDFDSWEEYKAKDREYTKELAKWTLRQEKRAEAAERAKAEAEALAKAEQDKIKSRVEEFKKTTPDYDEVIESFPDDIQFPDVVVQAIKKTDMTPEVLYALAKDVDLAKRIAGLQDPVAAAMAIGKLESSLEAKAKTPPAKKQVTSAPAPPKTVQGKTVPPAPSITDDALASNYSAWVKEREAATSRR